MIRVGLSWILDWLGNLISIVYEHVGHPYWMYCIYNWLLVQSESVQGNDPRGPWHKHEQEEN